MQKNITVKLQMLERRKGNESATQRIPEVLTQNDTRAYRLVCRLLEGTEDIAYTDAANVLFVFTQGNAFLSMGQGQIDSAGVYYDIDAMNDLRNTGWVTCSVQLMGSGGEKLTVSEFQFEVRRDPTSLPSAPPLPPNYGALQQIIDDCITATNAANQKAGDADTAAQNAQNIANQIAQDATNGVYNGKSAYELWLAAGNTGSMADYLASLKGEKGDSGASTADRVSVDTSQYPLNSVLKPEHGTAQEALVALGEATVVETGSNANGNYWKYADGRLICLYKTDTKIMSGTTVYVPLFGATATQSTVRIYTGTWVNLDTWQYPHAFSSAPFITFMARAENYAPITLRAEGFWK